MLATDLDLLAATLRDARRKIDRAIEAAEHRRADRARAQAAAAARDLINALE